MSPCILYGTTTYTSWAGAYATYAALMESLCEGLRLLWVGQKIFAIHD